jgi:hypothetical protein
METIFAHPAVEVFVLVTGDSDYFPWSEDSCTGAAALQLAAMRKYL